MTIQIRTNNVRRPFKYRNEVPAAVLKSQFDWMDAAHTEHGDYSDGFICYRGHWSHLSDYMHLSGGPLTDAGWHGGAADSYFSGTVIRVANDGETYQIGSYCE